MKTEIMAIVKEIKDTIKIIEIKKYEAIILTII
jgi:hypothetical protein